ncbi:MAG: YhbY family RNA-binding protein [Candidatus Helarchaeota archaeon]
MKLNKLNEVKANPAQIIVGKKGLSEEILNNIKKKIKKDKIIKIKILKTAPEFTEMDRKTFADAIAKNLDVSLVEVRGYNLILQKKQK